MAVKLHTSGFEHAKELVEEGKMVLDERDDWSEHQPSAEEKNEFIRRHGMAEYGKWHLGIDDEEDEDNKGRYKFPYGDFKKIHRCAILAAESRAGQYKYFDIENAVAHLHGMTEADKPAKKIGPPSAAEWLSSARPVRSGSRDPKWSGCSLTRAPQSPLLPRPRPLVGGSCGQEIPPKHCVLLCRGGRFCPQRWGGGDHSRRYCTVETTRTIFWS